MATTRKPLAAVELSRKRKRELGLLPRQVMFGAMKLARAGDIDKDMTAKEIAFVYVASVSESAEYGAAWKKVSAPDWDSLLAFIEKLMELFLKFLPMFL